jgi:hypothetical protein
MTMTNPTKNKVKAATKALPNGAAPDLGLTPKLSRAEGVGLND